jgi:riboflavin kinase/FMN adenylyltransferase
MEIIREVNNYQSSDKPLHLDLGNFDGVHLGHRRLITEMVNRARINNGLAAAFIFEPHPSKIINPDQSPKLLINLGRKSEFLGRLGLDILIYNSFTPEISRWTPEEFVERILIKRLKVKEVFIGFNYSFGHKGLGDPPLMVKYGLKYNFQVHIIPPVLFEGEIVSSSAIRRLLEAGNITGARDMLTYSPIIEGKVIEGEHRGLRLGFPTANLEYDQDLSIPGRGVYAAFAWVRGNKHRAVVNIGQKPTFHKVYPTSVEVHLLDFAQDIYGETVKLEFLEKIRDEQRFASVEELVKQIKLDCEKAAFITSLAGIEP